MNNLRDNQKKAVEQFEEHYYNNSNTRGILSMCCGSGKTRTFYEIMKKCISFNENFFIYATSRILLVQGIVQEIIEWIYKEKLNIDILIKVSEFNILTIKSEIIKKNNKDTTFNKFDFENYFDLIKKNNIKVIGNNEKDIEDVLKSRYILENKKILIITTYDSINKIIKGISDYNKNKNNDSKEIIPNLLTCDESHNLVSSDNNIITAKLILEENEYNLFYPEKYLFMTATPLKIIKRNNTDNFVNNDIVYSMHNEILYGKVFYEYTFYEGIQNKYILDFDVIYLSDFDTNDNDIYIKKAFEDLRFIDDKNEQQYIYFNIISQYLLKTIKLYNLKHTLVYLSNQAKAEILYKILQKDINDKKLKNEVGFIISDQKLKDKKINQKIFETYNGTSKILLTVDIFNEGIDIPICDSILFAEERNSETVIVQNIGRSLRIYNNENENNNFIKKKAYIILPTKIYTCENIEENAFSSKFKKIRDVCDILREPPEINNPRYFIRKTKGDNKTFKNDNDDENINEKSGLVDNIIKQENDLIEQENINNDIKQKLDELSKTIFNSYEIISSCEKVSNIKLEKLKQIVQNAKINNLYNLTIFLQEKCIIIDKPHLYYKHDWLCYGDFLFNKIYTYKEAINTIQLLNLNNINSPKEWLNYYNNLIDLAFKNECDIDLFNKIIYIPYDPKTYYLVEWGKIDDENFESIGWNKFLGKSLDNITGLEIITKTASSSINALNNLKNLINQDKYKVKKLIKNEWQTFNEIKTDIYNLKNYIDTYFSINSKIEVRFRLTNSYALHSQILNVKIPELSEYVIPITINFSYKILYDENIYDIKNLKLNKINKNKEEFIYNKEIQNIINNIKNELTQYINEHKQDIIL